MVKELQIILNGPPNQAYIPGSAVSGRLVVEVDGQPKSYHYIQVSLFGRAHVEFSMINDQYRIKYTSDEVYASGTLVLWSKEQSPDQKLHPGLYNFPFRFLLPTVLPSSYHVHDRNGPRFICYTVEGKIGTGYLADRIALANIPVIEAVQVHSVPALQAPVRTATQKTVNSLLCCATGPLFTMTVQIPRTGYCVGEEIPVNVEIENGSNRHFRLNAILHKDIVYTGQATALFMSQYTRQFVDSAPVVGVESHRFPPGTTTTWNPTEIKIPPTETTMTPSSCRIINISYFLEVTAVISWSRNLVLVIPITIGNDLPTPVASSPCPMTSQQPPQQFRAFPPHPDANVHLPSKKQ